MDNPNGLHIVSDDKFKTSPLPTVDHYTQTIDNEEKYNNGNGGGNMEDYVTHRELQSELEKQDLKVKNQFTETNSKINELEIKMNSRFNKIDARFDNINDKFDSLPEKIENIVMKNNQERDKEQKETRRYLWGGTIFIGTVSMIISIIALF